MDSFLKRFFPRVYRQKQDSKVSHYCEFNSELLIVFLDPEISRTVSRPLIVVSDHTHYG